MSGHDEEVLGKLSEELTDALFANEHIDAQAWAQRFGVDVAAVEHCQRGLQALAMSLGEEANEGHPELPQPQLPQDFEVRGELGRGGMGVVYRARQRSLDRDVAIKVLRPGDLVFGDALRRFRSEARSLARLRHRHIVSIYDSGETPEGLLWFAMDLVDGQTLAEELRQKGRMLPARATKIIRQITSAIAHAHAQGIVHRDLKPQNVLIDGQGDAFVVDFGLARDASAANTRTMSGELLGTPAYMSPEQARGDSSRIGEASDVWALGALLYEMLVGKGPYSGKPLHETIRAILEDEPKPMRRGDKRVPEALEHICLHALQKRPEDRYAGALAFGEDLERFQDGRGITAQRPSKLRRIGRVLKTRWRGAAMIAAAIVVTLTAVAMWLPSIRRDAIVAEAQRLTASGYPDAAIASLQPIVASANRLSSEFESLELQLVQALNDRTGELLLANDDAGAIATAKQALQIADRRARSGGVILPEEFAQQQIWRWQLARASAVAERLRQPYVDAALLQADLQSGLPGRMASARRSATMGTVDLSQVDESLQLEIVRDGLRAEARDIDNQKGQGPSWMDAIDSFWSPRLEDLLAELTATTTESMTTRALAFRMWSKAVGLPTFALLAAKETTVGYFPTAEQVVAVAPVAIDAWRTWRDLPRELACKARVQLLVLAMAKPAEVLPATNVPLLAVACQWTGYEAASTDAFSAWWQQAQARPYEQLLRNGLELKPEQPVTLVEALDRSAEAPNATARLWRQLAWLQIPDGIRIPEYVEQNDSGHTRWRNECLRAALQVDTRALTARIAVLRFDDGSCTPEIVAQQSQLVHIGESVRMELRANVVEPSLFTIRKIWDDDRPADPYPLPDAQVLTASSPKRGELTATVRGDIRFGYSGLRFVADNGWRLRHELPWVSSQDHDQGTDKVWLHSAGALDAYTVCSDHEQRITTFVLMFALQEVDHQDAAATVDATAAWWHQAAANSFLGAVEAEANFVAHRSHSVDWLTASFWPMPEAQAAIDTLLAASPQRTDQAIRMAAMLASGHPEYLTQAALFGAGSVTAATVRLATSSTDAAVREQALAVLESMPATFWTPRIAATLRAAAANGSVVLPPKLSQTLQSLPTPGGWWEWLTRAAVWQGLLLALVITFLAKRWLHYPSDRARTIVASVGYAAFWLLFVRLKLGGVILTPSFVPLLVMLACLTWASRGHRGWRIAGIVVIGLFTLWSVGSWCFGLDAPPRSTPGMLLIAGMMVLGTPSSRRAHRASRTKPEACHAT